jgi:hypothetical protein
MIDGNSIRGNSIYDYPLQRVCLSQNTKINQKTSHGSYRTTNTADYLAVQKTITGILDSRYCTCQMKKDLNVKLNRVKENLGNGDI